MPLEVYSENVWICSTLLSCEVSQATNVYLYTCSDFLNHITSHWHHCHGHIKVVENIITIQVNPSEQLFSIMWEASKRIPKTHQNSDSWVLNGWNIWRKDLVDGMHYICFLSVNIYLHKWGFIARPMYRENM